MDNDTKDALYPEYVRMGAGDQADTTQALGAAELDRLEALARAATPGDWEAQRHGVIVAGPMREYANGSARSQIAAFTSTFHDDDHEDEPDRKQANAEFCAAANPVTVLALIEQARRAAAPHAAEMDECAANMNGHRFGPHGRKGEMQCEWCGVAAPAAVPGSAVQAEPVAYMYMDDAEKAERDTGSFVMSRVRLSGYRNEIPLFAAPPVAAGAMPDEPTEEMRQAFVAAYNFEASQERWREAYRAMRDAVALAPVQVGAQVAAPADSLTDVLRDMLAIQEACGLHTDEYAPGSVIEYIKELEADQASVLPPFAAPASQHDANARDAARYRYLRDPATDIGNVIDKQFAPGSWEYRAGDELDAAIDAAMGGPEVNRGRAQGGNTCKCGKVMDECVVTSCEHYDTGLVPSERAAAPADGQQHEAVAQFMEKKAADFAREFGSMDTQTGFLSFPDEDHEDTYQELLVQAARHRATSHPTAQDGSK